MKNKLIIGGVALVVLGVIMGVTNPNEEAYAEYIVQRVVNEGEKAFCKDKDACEKVSNSGILTGVISNLAKPALERAVKKSTIHYNLLLFSVYKTKIARLGSIRTIGVFGRFFVYYYSGEQ